MKKILFMTFCLIYFNLSAQDTRGFKTKEQIEAEKNNQQKSIVEGHLPQNGTLKLKIKTNKGSGSVEFKEGEKMTISYFVNEPCYLRLIYRLADNKIILLRDGLQVTAAETNKWKQLSDIFECSSPFGYENLIMFASATPFDGLQTNVDSGYEFITGDLEKALNSSRGMKKISDSSPTQKVEDQILVITKKK